MARFTTTKNINASPDHVFEVFSDLRGAADRISAIKRMEVLTDGPVGVGTRFRETRIMFKREATEEMEVTTFVPGHHYTLHCESCGSTFDTVFRFTPDGSATRVDVEFQCRTVSFFAKIMSPLSSLMMGWCMKAFDKDLEELKKAIENGKA